MTHAIKASIEVPLPADMIARATLVGKVAEAWSMLLTTVDKLYADAQLPAPKLQPALVSNGAAEDKPKLAKRRRGRPRKRK